MLLCGQVSCVQGLQVLGEVVDLLGVQILADKMHRNATKRKEENNS